VKFTAQVMAVGGWLIAIAAISSDWEMRASIAYTGGIVFGYAIALLYPLPSEDSPRG
jgi:hypothetical protein